MSDAATIKKLCVFCGNLPDEKTKEHVIPQWLLELTGDPNREASFGVNWTSSDEAKQGRERKYAFSSFHFPACHSCNEEFGKMEGKAKYVMLRVLADEYVNNDEITCLLDWFDKVRVGLWLAFNRLDNFSDIVEPKFHIQARQALKDRMLFIYDFEDVNRQGLTFVGVNTPVFYLMPSCFLLMVNNKLFISASTDYLVSKNLGFSYGEFVTIDEESSNPIYHIYPGTGNISYPVVGFSYVTGCTEIYQVVSAERNFYKQETTVKDDSHSDDYLLLNSLKSYISDDTIVSRIFYKEQSGKITILDEEDEVNLKPPMRKRPLAMGAIVRNTIANMQISLWLGQVPSYSNMNESQRAYMPEAIRETVKHQRLFARAKK